MNPVNLGFRFILELTAIAFYGIVGWRVGNGAGRFILAAVLPLAAIMLWGLFNVPGDPSRSGKAPVAIPGFLRLLLELAILWGSAALMALTNSPVSALSLAIAVLIHYLFSYRRVRWLITGK